MTTEQNKAIVRRFWASFETNDQAALKELLAPAVVGHLPGTSRPANREAMLQGISMFNAALSEFHVTIEELIAEGEKVATRMTMRAVHTGDFLGVPPTGNQIVGPTISVEHIKEGKIVERWVSYDLLGLMQQLGAVSPPQAN